MDNKRVFFSKYGKRCFNGITAFTNLSTAHLLWPLKPLWKIFPPPPPHLSSVSSDKQCCPEGADLTWSYLSNLKITSSALYIMALEQSDACSSVGGRTQTAKIKRCLRYELRSSWGKYFNVQVCFKWKGRSPEQPLKAALAFLKFVL